MSQARYVKPYAEIVDPERGSYGQPPQDNLFPDEKKSTIESGISLIDMPSARDMTRVKPDKEAAYDEKEADVKVVTVIANPVLPSAAAAAKSSQMQVFAIRAGFIFLGVAFLAVYIFLIIFATLQTRSAANAPKSQLGGYSTSDYGWDVTAFNILDFIDSPKALSGRLTSGKNIKNTGNVRIEVFFNSVTPAASGGGISVTLRLIVPETWKDESKPPKPWYTITCQFGTAVISVGPNSTPSSYDQVYPNFRLEEGSYNQYPFDAYSADATAWCYFDATATNAKAPVPPTPPGLTKTTSSPTRSPTAVGGCLFQQQVPTSPCCQNLYTYNDPVYGTFVNATTLYDSRSGLHMFGCCSSFAECCSQPIGGTYGDDDAVPNQGGPLSTACILKTTTAADPSPCNSSRSDYTRANCAQALYNPFNFRKLSTTSSSTSSTTSTATLSAQSSSQIGSAGIANTGGRNNVKGEYVVEVAKEVEEEVEGERRLMPAAVYTSISPLFYPASGYLNFEVAIEKSDSGVFMHSQLYNGITIKQATDLYYGAASAPPVVVIFDVIEFPIITFNFIRAPISKVFAVYLMIALWMIVLSHTFVNLTFYLGLKKVDVSAIVTGAVTVLFALPAVRSTMPGAPPLGAIMDFAVYFWCIIISVSHILAISGMWLNHTFLNPPPKKEDKPTKVIIVEAPVEKEKKTL